MWDEFGAAQSLSHFVHNNSVALNKTIRQLDSVSVSEIDFISLICCFRQ